MTAKKSKKGKGAAPWNGNFKNVKSDMQILSKGIDKVVPTVIIQNRELLKQK